MTDRGETLYYKRDNFLLRNYSEGEKTKDLIKQFVVENKDSNLLKYSQYDMVFYKESQKTNIQNLKENPRDLNRYSQSHDLLFDFMWAKGKFVKMFEYKNGKMLSTDDIIVKPSQLKK